VWAKRGIFLLLKMAVYIMTMGIKRLRGPMPTFSCVFLDLQKGKTNLQLRTFATHENTNLYTLMIYICYFFSELVTGLCFKCEWPRNTGTEPFNSSFLQILFLRNLFFQAQHL
jgi:hypothetical protein